MNEFLRLLTFLCILVAVAAGLLEKYTHKHGNVHHGRYTRDIEESELLIPRRVFEDGSFNTYTLPNFYDRQEMNERRKRSLEADEEFEDDKLHLVLPFNGMEHHVELRPYHEFISPEMVIETRGSGISTNINEAVRFKRASDQQCHYRGVVRGHDNSRAALSLCEGVVGYVQTNHGRYFIEPLNDAEPEVDGEHVHIAYKRDATQKTGENNPKKHFCGTNDNWESAWAEQLEKRQNRIMENNSIVAKPRGTSYTHSIHRFIEIGLIADRRFLDFHNNTNYEQYLLTVMNMVSDYYHDGSSGNQIDVVVVRMIYLEKEKEEIDLLISSAAEDTLESFARWAEKMNPKDHNHPNHYDIAVLVTRYDICTKGTNCDLMGLAYVGAACDSSKAACINEDNGLLLGIVIAHEVGHVMGCSHDEPESSGCPSQDKDESYFVMSPIVFIYTIRWSSCSRKFITAFLESGLGECLNDDPKSPSDKFKYPNMLPGAMYDADFQCDMMFPGQKMCPQSTKVDCGILWCSSAANSSCYSLNTPLADGTKCGEKKWCIHKKCVDIGTRPAAVNGGWGLWGPMSSCSRSCGGGVKYSERECDNPVPSNGGRYCIGERKKISTCNTTPCDPTKPPYRAVQCSEQNHKKVLSDGLHEWTPFSQPNLDPCALYCINEKRTFVKISPSVNDSTPCKPGTNYMCIAGTCRKVGCDWVLDSDVIEDKCGVCKGDGTKCIAMDGYFNKTGDGQGYEKIVTIPRGARSIQVAEKKPDVNVVAVRTERDNSKYCLNGGNKEERSGDYECAGAIIIYTHPEPDKEEIEIKGPISEEIRIEYAFFNPKSNPGVQYKYFIMATNASFTPKYLWDFVEWSECDAKCGGGTMISKPSCVEEHGGKVTPIFCHSISRPEPKSRICNQEPCPAKWRVSQWSKCSACDGKKGTRHRKVQCVKPAAHSGEDDVQMNLDACKGRVPKQTEDCIGVRPCRRNCQKRIREASNYLDKAQQASVVDQSQLIDRFIDQSLARYLEKVRGLSREDDKFERSGNSLDDSKEAMEDKRKRSTCDKEFSTPVPGSIIKDIVPVRKVVLLQAPYIEESLQSNLSDKAFQEAGDLAGVGIDTSREKVFKGEQAVKMIEQLTRKNSTSPRRRSVDCKEKSYEDLSGVVDELEE